MNRATIEGVAALALGAVLVAVGSLVTNPQSVTPDLRASTYVSERAGVRGLFEVLAGTGAQPSRLVDRPPAGLRTDATLVIAAPSQPILSKDVDALLDWTARGGRLVLIAPGPSAATPIVHHTELLARLGLALRLRRIGSRAVRVSEGSGLDSQATIEWTPHSSLRKQVDIGDPRLGGAEPLVETRSALLAVRVPYGDRDGDGDEPAGEVVVLSDELLFNNEHLRRADNSVLAVGLLTARTSDDGRVVFDEFHHGFRVGGERPGIVATLLPLIVTSWPGRALLVALGAWVVYLLGVGRRLGSPLPDVATPRRALSEHAEALGRLLENAQAGSATLQVLAAGTRRVVGQRSGLSPTLSAAEFQRRLAASTVPGAHELALALQRADMAGEVRHAEVARLARQLARARRRYLYGR